MAMNMIQFQAGLSMLEFVEQYGTEAKYRRALYRARWPKGFRCPACGDRRRSTFRRGAQVYYQCRACQHQTTLIAGTLFAATKLPLRTWFVAIYALTTTKTNVAALELMRQLGVCYRTAWRLKHKILKAMTDREESRQLAGFVQVDDAYLGGELSGGKPGRGSPNKQPFVIAVATDETLEHPTYAVIEPVRSFDNASILDWGKRRLAPDAEVYSDGLACFARVVDLDHAHTVLDVAGRRAATQAAARAGSTSCSATSSAPSAAATTPSSNASTPGVTLPKRPTGSIAVFACASCCLDSRAPLCSATLALSDLCDWRAIFFTEIWR